VRYDGIHFKHTGAKCEHNEMFLNVTVNGKLFGKVI